jgi:Na+-driven multidrug efflux pump
MTNNPIHSENIIGTQPINKLLLSMSVPMMLSMVVQALYNIIDSIFVAQIGEAAQTYGAE